MKHIFIINPKSGNGKSYELISVIQDYFKGKEDEYEIITTEAPGHASVVASEYKDADCIYAIGGDGTAYEVLNGIQAGVSMAIIPAGSGNDYFSMLKVSNKSLKDIIHKTIEGKIVKVDYGLANGHKFLNCFCMGIDAEVVKHANEYSKKYPIPNKMSYMVSALKTIMKPKAIHASIVVDEECFSMEAMLMAVMNGQYYGGGFSPAPMASIQDGQFDILFVDYLKRRKIIPLLPKYFKGKHGDVEAVHSYSGKTIKIELETEWVYCCDGEVYYDSVFEIKMVEKGLLLKVPVESELE